MNEDVINDILQGHGHDAGRSGRTRRVGRYEYPDHGQALIRGVTYIQKLNLGKPGQNSRGSTPDGGSSHRRQVGLGGNHTAVGPHTVVPK